MKVAYFCHELAPIIVKRSEEAVRCFPSFLHRFVPEIPCELSPLDGRLVALVLKAIREQPDFFCCADAVGKLLLHEIGADEFEHKPSLIVCCCADSTLSQMGKSTGYAEWGCHYGRLVAIYHHDPDVIPYLIWHEMCHLIGAEDCYKLNAANEVTRDRDRTCGKDNCIMQYEPCEKRVGDSPIICDKNIGLIQKLASERTKSTGG